MFEMLRISSNAGIIKRWFVLEYNEEEIFMLSESIYFTGIGKVLVGRDRPKIAASIMAYDENDFVRKAKIANAAPCDLIELRCDALAMGRYRSPEIIKTIVLAVKDVTDKPIILTIRSMEEGGMANIERKSYYALIRDIIEIFDLEAIKPEAIDIEAFDKDYGPRSDMMEFIVNLAHDVGMKVIISNHDVAETPPVDDIVKRLIIVDQFGADIPKVAYMPKNSSDVQKVITAAKLAEEHIGKPYVTISMGTLGKKTRLYCNEEKNLFKGTAITFGALNDEYSAEGQPDVFELADELNKVLQNKT